MTHTTRSLRVEVFQFVEGPQNTPDWLAQAACLPEGVVGKVSPAGSFFGVFTDTGWKWARYGDWIVRHAESDIRVIKQGDFDRLYEETA